MSELTKTEAPVGPPWMAGAKSAGRKPDVKREVNAFSGIAHIALFVWALATAGPLIWVLLSSFKNNTEIFLGQPFALPESFSFQTYVDAWNTAHVGQYFLNSVFVVAVSTAGTMLFGSMAAYVLARYQFPGNRFIYYMFLSGLTLPVFMAAVPLYKGVYLVGESIPFLGPNSYGMLILVYVAWSLSFTVFFMHSFFKTLPTSIAEAATMDGASHARLFFSVMLPIAKPGLLSIGIFNVLGQWNQWYLPVLLMQPTGGEEKRQVLSQGLIELSVNQGYKSDWAGLFAGLTMAMLPVLIVYIVFQRQVQAGLTGSITK